MLNTQYTLYCGTNLKLLAALLNKLGSARKALACWASWVSFSKSQDTKDGTHYRAYWKLMKKLRVDWVCWLLSTLMRNGQTCSYLQAYLISRKVENKHTDHKMDSLASKRTKNHKLNSRNELFMSLWIWPITLITQCNGWVLQTW